MAILKPFTSLVVSLTTEEALRAWMLPVAAARLTEAIAGEREPCGYRSVRYYDKARMEVSQPEASPDSLWYVTNLFADRPGGRARVCAARLPPLPQRAGARAGCAATLLPASARAPDGRLFLFPRVVAANNYSRIGIAEVVFDANGDPTRVERRGYALEPAESYEQNARTAGCEDARVTYVEPLRRYLMTYTAYGPLGPRIALAESADLLSWRRLGPVKFGFDPALRVDFDLYDNKDAALFPEPVRDPHGRPALALIHRPAHVQGGMAVLPAGVNERRACIWISYCDVEQALKNPGALLTWRDHQLLAAPERSWEEAKIGGGTPPIRTTLGWLMVYHGVAGTILDGVDHQPYVHYCAGAMVLDLDDPRNILYRSPEPILAPETEEERTGVVSNVVFPTGVDRRTNDRVDVYYGMADAAIGVARLDIPDHLH